MSRLFRRPSARGVANAHDDPNSVFSSLLKPVSPMQTAAAHAQQDLQPPRRRTKSSPGALAPPDHHPHHQHHASLSSRPWLSLLVAERQSGGGTGDRPAKRKLVKDPGSAGSARPSFSVELPDQGEEGDRRKDDGWDRGVAMVRRGAERIRELYRREKG